MASRPPIRSLLPLAILASCAGTTLARPDAGGQPPADQPRATLRAEDISGRDFAGQRLPVAATEGPLFFAARKAARWTEPAADSAAPVTRLLLEGDVQASIGLYDFQAQRVAVWLQRVSPAGAPAVYQVYAYFDRVDSPEGDAAVTFSAERLPVQAVVRPSGPVRFRADLISDERPVDQFLNEAEGTLAAAIRRFALPPEPAPVERDPLLNPPKAAGAEAPLWTQLGAAGANTDTDRLVREALADLPPTASSEPIFAKDGIITIATGGSWRLVSGREENSAIIDGGITVEYQDLQAQRSVQITAQRAVIFLPPGKIEALGRLKQEDIRGIYLEGDVVAVASGGRYTLRGPRIFYDVQRQKAVVVDAVFWTFDQQRRLPLYLRAETIRQESERQFTAESATLTNTGFLNPVLSVGASSLTISSVPRAEPSNDESPRGGFTTLIDAEDITLAGMKVPFFYFPRFRGYPDQIPLRDIRVESSSGSGTAIKTTWNMYGLLGAERPKDHAAELLLDYYTKRGFGGGANFLWGDSDSAGRLLAYGIPNDDGTDVTTTGVKIDQNGDPRGIFLGEHRARIDRQWTIFLEGAYISDPTFVDALFRPLAQTRREFTNRAYLRRLEDNTAFSAELKGTFNDFIANEYLLQTPGYVVNKTPDLMYSRLGDDLLSDIAPGRLSWFSENRVTRMRMVFDQDFAYERGFNTDDLAQRAFGISANQRIEDRLRAMGYVEEDVWRLDTRQEFRAPLDAGPVRVTPFAVGRVSVYDNDFESFSPDEDENVRAWGSVGLTLSTTLQHVDDTVDAPVFGLHRLRHIIEPHATVWTAGTNVQSDELPVYDPGVEGIQQGSMVSFGLSQTFQTQRGGPGRWYNADVLKLDTDFTFWSNDAETTSPIGRFVTYRPELSNPGNFMTNSAVWQTSDTLALTGSSVFDFDRGQQSRSSFGALVDHWPGFYSSFDLRNVHADSTTYFDVASTYQLTSKYWLTGAVSLDINEDRLQQVGAEIRRRYPGVVIGVGVSYNQITDDTSFGFLIQPEGLRTPGARLQGLGSNDDRNRASGIGN